MACFDNYIFDVKYTPYNFFKPESTAEKADRLERDLKQLQTSQTEERSRHFDVLNSVQRAIERAEIENRDELKVANGTLAERVSKLVTMCVLAEQGEREIRYENEELRSELASVSSCLASVTERMAMSA